MIAISYCTVFGYLLSFKYMMLLSDSNVEYLSIIFIFI